MRVLGLVLGLVWGCGAEAPPEVPVREGSPEEALRACAHAQSRSAAMPPAKAADLIAEACADVFAEPGCSDGWKRFMDVPIEARAITVTRACARAYCPILTDDPPVLCEIPEEQWTPSRLPALNGELAALAVAHDWNQPVAPDLRERLREAAAAAPTTATSVFPTALPQAEGVPVLKLVPPARAILGNDLEERHFDLPAQKEELTAALRALPSQSEHLVVQADSDVAFSAIRDAMDAATAAGRTQVSYSVTK